jgi:hypothetical protein
MAAGIALNVGIRRAVRGVLLCAAILVGANAVAAVGNPCDDSLTRRIPLRPSDAPGGRQFAERIESMSGQERETLVQQQLLSGNVPDFLRHLRPVYLRTNQTGDQNAELVVCAAPDYLAIGSDQDFLLIPVQLETALTTAGRFDLSLPTPRIVDAIYAQAAVQFVPQPLPAGDTMRSTAYFQRHNTMIEAQRAALGVAPGLLSAGHKKDLVITNRLWSNLDRVAIYGWELIGGAPIQPLSTVHGWRYVDYSHGARLISTHVFVNGRPRLLNEVLADPRLASALSSEGVISDVRGLMERLVAVADVPPR